MPLVKFGYLSHLGQHLTQIAVYEWHNMPNWSVSSATLQKWTFPTHKVSHTAVHFNMVFSCHLTYVQLGGPLSTCSYLDFCILVYLWNGLSLSQSTAPIKSTHRDKNAPNIGMYSLFALPSSRRQWRHVKILWPLQWRYMTHLFLFFWLLLNRE